MGKSSVSLSSPVKRFWIPRLTWTSSFLYITYSGENTFGEFDSA